MAYRIIDRAVVNYQPSVYTTAGYPGINTSGGDINIVNNVSQTFNLISGITNTNIGALPEPKIILNDRPLASGSIGYIVDYFSPGANDIGGQIEFMKSVCINTNDFTQDFLDNNYVFLEMLIYKRKNQRVNYVTTLVNNSSAWGDNNSYQLADGSTTPSYIPLDIPGSQSFNKIAAGIETSFFIDNNDDTIAYGYNDEGELGDGTFFSSQFGTTPTGGHKFKKISSRYGYSLAIDDNNDIWSWGVNTYGELGLGDTAGRNEPEKITSSTTFQKISAGIAHSLAIDINGFVWVWGANFYGQLGLNDFTNRLTPIKLTGFSTSFIDISSSGSHSLLLDINGNVWVSGDNTYGQLGLGNYTNKKVFTQVTGLTTTFKQVVASTNFSLLLDNDGFVWSVGKNDYGQLGNNSTISGTSIFSQIYGGVRFTKIDASSLTDIAGGIDINKSLWFWGNNIYGQFGNGTTTSSNFPMKINNDNEYYELSIGVNHVLAINKIRNKTSNFKYTKSAYIVPSAHYVTNNYQYPTWGQSFWTRSGAHYVYNSGTATANLMNIDRPNHRRVEKINELMDVTDFYNGRFIEWPIKYRKTDGTLDTYNTLIPYESGARRGGIGVGNRYSYSPQYCSMYSAFRYIIFDPTANQGRGQIYSGPISKIVKITHQYQPFIDDYHANAIIGLPTAYINPKHEKYKFLPRIENKLP